MGGVHTACITTYTLSPSPPPSISFISILLSLGWVGGHAGVHLPLEDLEKTRRKKKKKKKNSERLWCFACALAWGMACGVGVTVVTCMACGMPVFCLYYSVPFSGLSLFSGIWEEDVCAFCYQYSILLYGHFYSHLHAGTSLYMPGKAVTLALYEF